MEIDYDYLRAGTAIGFRSSRELCSNYLFKTTSKWYFIVDRCTVQCIAKLDLQLETFRWIKMK